MTQGNYSGDSAQFKIDSLLEPSLEKLKQFEPIFSVMANFMVAFFGGVYAIAYFSNYSVVRLNRVREDLWILAAAVIIWTIIFVSLAFQVATGEYPAWLDFTGHAPRTVRYLGRAIALLLCGIMFLRHRKYHTAQTVAGIDPPKPYKEAIISIIVGVAVSFAFTFMTALVARGVSNG